MGYRIWRKDKNVWSLAFDTIYETQDKVNDAIAELKAAYHELMKYGDVEFLPISIFQRTATLWKIRHTENKIGRPNIIAVTGQVLNCKIARNII
jgi:hypothetical protein